MPGMTFVEKLILALVVSAVSTLVTLTITGLRDYFSRRRLEREYNVSGEYVTRYEDPNGEATPVWRTAPALLKQSGHRVTASTRLDDDSKEWILEGELSGGRYFHGVYDAKSKYDPSFNR